MKLLMISGDRSILQGKKGAFWYTLQGLRKHFERIDIVCPRARMPSGPATAPSPAMPSGGGAVVFHPNPRGLFRQPRWIAREGRRLVEEHRHDVMTVHEYPPFYNGAGALRLHRSTGIPFVLEIHHIVGWPVASAWTEAAGRMLSRWRLPREASVSAAVRTVNTDVARKLESWGVPRGKLHVVPSFYLDAELLRRPSAPPQIYDIACCARLVANKGMEQVIDAVARMDNARLVIIGDGPLRPALERRVRSHRLGDRVTFLGWLPTQESVVEALRSARVFVMASTSEGGPRSALEAMACGMPVVVTRVGVMPEVVIDGENGCFTDGTPGDIAGKIGRLLHDEGLRERFGARAATVLDLYERDRLIERYAEFLKKVGERRGS